MKAKRKVIENTESGGEDEQVEDGDKKEMGHIMSKKELGRMKMKMKVLERERTLAETEERQKLRVGPVEVEMEMKINTEERGREGIVRKRSDDGEEEGVKRVKVDHKKELREVNNMDQS